MSGKEQKPKPERWREYIVRLPGDFADLLEKARSEQQQMEDRPIEMSELMFWLLTMGIQGRETLLEQQRQAEQRVSVATHADLGRVTGVGVTCGCGVLPIHSTADPRFHPEAGR